MFMPVYKYKKPLTFAENANDLLIIGGNDCTAMFSSYFSDFILLSFVKSKQLNNTEIANRNESKYFFFQCN